MRRLPASAANRLRAFTLIELLVVIVILGILMAVALPTFLRQQSKAQDSRTQQYLTTAYKAIRASTPDTNNQYPNSTSLVSWVQQSEPELTVQRASCYTGSATAPTDAVLVDPASTASSLLLCARSASGNLWELSATATGAPSLINGTLVPLTFSGNEITDATRAADVQGDGLSNDSSTGIWEATTNLVPNGGFESDASGATGIGNCTVARSTVRSEFGSASLAATNTAAGNFTAQVGTSTGKIAVNPSVTYTASGWGRASASVSFQIQIKFYDSSGAQIGSSNGGTTGPINDSGWWRSVSTATAPSNAASALILLAVTGGPAAGTVAYFDGIQLEQKSFATPYVDTNGASASRAAARVQAPASLLNATQGWVAVRARLDFASTSSPDPNNGEDLFSWFPGGSPLFELRWIGGASNVWQGRRRDSSGSGSSPSVSDSFSVGAYRTLIFMWTASQTGLSVNGSAFSLTSNSNVPSGMPSNFDIGSLQGNSRWADADLMWFATGTGTLSNTDAATINAWGNTDPTRASFPSAAQVTMTWDGTSTTGSLK